MSTTAPVSPVYKEQTGEAVREFLITNKHEIDKSVSARLRHVLDVFELRCEVANGTNDKENKALRAM